MAAKTLREAINRVWKPGNIDEETVAELEGELRDFFAHEVMKFTANRDEVQSATVQDFFDRIFGNIPAFKKAGGQ